MSRAAAAAEILASLDNWKDHHDPREAGRYVELLVQRSQRRKQRRAKVRVADNGIPHEGQGHVRSQALRQQGRLEIEHAVAQPVVGAGAAVMQLVGMQHDDVAGQAPARGPSIAERLHTRERHADRIGVVAMEIESRAAEPRLDPLDAVRGRRLDDAVFRSGRAQTSKTLKGFLR